MQAEVVRRALRRRCTLEIGGAMALQRPREFSIDRRNAAHCCINPEGPLTFLKYIRINVLFVRTTREHGGLHKVKYIPVDIV